MTENFAYSLPDLESAQSLVERLSDNRRGFGLIELGGKKDKLRSIKDEYISFCADHEIYVEM